MSRLSLRTMWLSRSASQTDALDDDETPLRLTAFQTATTREVTASEIMGALDIAPSLHFVEPVLKINGKERIKVMDECVHCAQLRSPSGAWALSFYCSWTTRRRTFAGWRLITTERGQAAVGCSRKCTAERHNEKRHPRAFDFP